MEDDSNIRLQRLTWLAAGCMAGMAGVLFAVAQVDPMADWGVTISVYAAALGMPAAAAASMLLFVISDRHSPTGRVVGRLLSLASASSVVAIAGLLAHFHAGVLVLFCASCGLCFAAAAWAFPRGRIGT